jgi:hypothetical protein
VKNVGRLDFTGPRRRLGAFLAERGLTHLDLAPGISSAMRAGSPPLYFERDMHWTESGNAVASALVARFVAELYSRPSEPAPAPATRPASFPPAPESSSTTGPPL